MIARKLAQTGLLTRWTSQAKCVQTFTPVAMMSKAAAASEKKSSPLAALRKRSGYSLTLCKKALEVNGHDVEKSHKWLQDQAQEQGWNKAQKLEGRSTAQGLIGVLVQGNSASMIELNCETDFVARNKQFLSLLQDVSALNLKSAESLKVDDSSHVHVKQSASDLKAVPSKEQGKTLADLVALNIGQIGENIVFNQGVQLSTTKSSKVKFFGFTHPSSNLHKEGLSYGRYGVLLAITKDKDGVIPEGQTLASMSRQLCQHIVGMNPTTIGNLSDPSTWPRKKESKSDSDIKPAEQKTESDAENPYGDYDTTVSDENLIDTSEEQMIHQPFLLDSDRLVREVLLETGITVKDFVRFEVGQKSL